MAGRHTIPKFDRILLIRCGSDVEDRLWDFPAAPEDSSNLVFLHGDAVESADRLKTLAVRSHAASFQVCRTSWCRRHPGRAPAPPFELSTLTRLIASIAAGAGRVDSDGLSGACCSQGSGDGGYLLEIAFAPDSPRQAEETVEWLLAAASLELDVRVLFSAGGLAHLRGEFAPAWRQFIDFDLAGLYAQTGNRVDPLDVDARCIEPSDAIGLRGDRRQVILL